jgi:hypothetical protein
MPTVEWHKQLQPESDNNYLEMLQQLQGMGIPIPHRMMAAAGGVDLDRILRQAPTDIKERELIQEYAEAVQEISGMGQGQQEQDQYGGSDPYAQEYASVKGAATRLASHEGSVSPVGLANREYDDSLDVINDVQAGNGRYIVSREKKQRVNEKYNRHMARFAAEQAKKDNHEIREKEKQNSKMVAVTRDLFSEN